MTITPNFVPESEDEEALLPHESENARMDAVVARQLEDLVAERERLAPAPAPDPLPAFVEVEPSDSEGC